MRPRHAVDALQVAVLAALLGFIEIGLRTMRAPRVADVLGVRFLAVEHAPTDVVASSPVTRRERRWCRNALRLLRRWPFDSTCLRRSLLIACVLRRHDPEVVIGVRTDRGSVEAHAWVRIGGRDLDPSAAQFVALARPVGS